MLDNELRFRQKGVEEFLRYIVGEDLDNFPKETLSDWVYLSILFATAGNLLMQALPTTDQHDGVTIWYDSMAVPRRLKVSSPP